MTALCLLLFVTLMLPRQNQRCKRVTSTSPVARLRSRLSGPVAPISYRVLSVVPVARGRARRHLAPTLRAFCEYIYGADGRRSLLLKHIKGWDAISAIICPVPTNIRKFGNPCVRQEIKLDCGERGKKRTLTKILNKKEK